MFIDQLLDNQLLTAGLAVLSVGGIGAGLRNVPGAIAKAAFSRYSVTLRVSLQEMLIQAETDPEKVLLQAERLSADAESNDRR